MSALIWPPTPVSLIPAVLMVPIGVFRAVRRIRRWAGGAVRLALDSRGVFLGEDDDRRPAQLVPWSAVDAIVHFHHRSDPRDEDVKPSRYVGVLRNGRIASARRVEFWRLDLDQLAEAAQRYGGVPVQHAPYQPTLPDSYR